MIISTYNWPQALSLCLQSIMRQSCLPAEVIIADDGSKQETANLIKEYQSTFPVALKHVWHPDEGFRLAAIRNKAIAEVSTDYIIQIDGDLILHPHFVEDHLEMKMPGYFIAGSRVMLSEKTTHKLIDNHSIDVKKYGVSKFNANAIRNIRLRNFLADRYKVQGKHTFYVKGCNMAFFKNDLIKINGYNEAFTGWGSEDREIAIRLINSGIKKRFLKNGGICYHLYHAAPSRTNELVNKMLREEAIISKSTWTTEGLNKYLIS